jgi:GntR family transcriptional regulator / MocR family aminotransferase
MSLRQCLALLPWADQTAAWVVEDDYDSEYRYAGRPLAPLQGLDNDGRVIYLGIFSKVLFPALRLGYMVVPLDPVDTFAAACAFVPSASPHDRAGAPRRFHP